MRSLSEWWRDCRRGYSDADLASVLQKVNIKAAQPGAFIPVTHREMRAHLAYLRKIYPLNRMNVHLLLKEHNDGQ